VLFGFLLTVPFTSRFGTLGGAERILYFGTLASAGAAAMLLIAPGAHHRMLFRCGAKEHIVRMANRYAIAGLACVALAMVGALSFIAGIIFDSAAQGAVAGIAGGACVWCWYLQPLRRRLQLMREADERGPATVSPLAHVRAARRR